MSARPNLRKKQKEKNVRDNRARKKETKEKRERLAMSMAFLIYMRDGTRIDSPRQ